MSEQGVRRVLAAVGTILPGSCPVVAAAMSRDHYPYKPYTVLSISIATFIFLFGIISQIIVLQRDNSAWYEVSLLKHHVVYKIDAVAS